MPLYMCQPPTGYKDTADAWVNTGALVSRMNFALPLAGNKLRGVSVAIAADRRRRYSRGDLSETTRATIAKATDAPTDGGAHARRAGISDGRVRRSHDAVTTSLSEERRVRLRQPRLRAVVPGAHGAAPAPGRSKQLIAIFQRGAVDGLSVVVPFGEADYYRARPSIAIPRPNGGDDGARSISTASSASTRGCSR